MSYIGHRAAQWVDSQERTIAARIFSLRTQKQICRSELAEAIGMSDDQVASYEYARQPIPVSILFIIAKALGVTPDYFYSDDASADAPADAIEAFEGFAYQA